jgi:hypothetical protein
MYCQPTAATTAVHTIKDVDVGMKLPVKEFNPTHYFCSRVLAVAGKHYEARRVPDGLCDPPGSPKKHGLKRVYKLQTQGGMLPIEMVVLWLVI